MVIEATANTASPKAATEISRVMEPAPVDPFDEEEAEAVVEDTVEAAVPVAD